MDKIVQQNQRKKKILFHSDFSLMKTGFARSAKALLLYLYNTGKYDIVHYCCHIHENNPDLQRTPWKSIGCYPENQREVDNILAVNDKGAHEVIIRDIWYGGLRIDQVIEKEKPDIYFGVQDFWGVQYSIDKYWFDKITSVIWTTLDSLPLFGPAVEKASKIKNYWIWSDFATKEFHRIGQKHVKTMHGALEDKFFKPLTKDKKQELRKFFNIDDRFIIGYVFRNQLRKSVPNLIEGYSLFKKNNPNIKSSLLLHTCFSEGWKIMDLAKQNNVPPEEILTTYICKACKTYFIHPFIGEEKDCPKCRCQKCLSTTNLGFGVTEEQLNEIYNIMDFYCHPFTSGGQEIPIQEAKMAGLITAVTDYSCGEEMCYPEAHSIPLKWESYREFGTEFVKATTLKESICKAMEMVYNMTPEEREVNGLAAREWAINNFSISNIGKQIEEYIDSIPYIDWSNISKQEVSKKNSKAEIPIIPNNKEWLKYLYKYILDMDVKDDDSGLSYWLAELNKGVSRTLIEEYFRGEAKKDEIKQTQPKTISLEEILDKEDKGKRILFVIPEGIGDIFLCTSLFNSLKQQYPDYNLYVSSKIENIDILAGNPHIHKTIPYLPIMDDLLAMEGCGKHNGFFEIAFLPHLGTQRMLNWVHNGKTKIAYKDLCI